MNRLSDWLVGQTAKPNYRPDAARKALAKALETDVPGPTPVLVRNLANYHFGAPKNALVASIVRHLAE
jgi:hypothetical protein